MAALAQEQSASAPEPSQAGQTETAASQQAPPDVEKALRDRVTQYYQDCVEHKFREAENLLAEESKDYFYNHEKPNYKGFEIQSIKWSDDFKQANVFVFLTVDMHLQNVTIPGHPTQESEWKLVDGQWFMHIITPQEKFVMPFGAVVKLDPEPQPGAPVNQDEVNKFSKANIKERATEILLGVKPDRGTVVLDSTSPGETTVHISNGTPSIVGLELVDPHMTGLSVKMDKTRLKPTEEATLTLRWKPKDKIAKPTAFIHVRTIPSGQDVPIRVDFSFNPQASKK